MILTNKEKTYMALGILSIIYITLIISAVIFQFLLYKEKSESKNSLFIMNMLFILLLVFIAFTSLPSNFIGQKILAITWGILSVMAVIVRVHAKQFSFASKVMLSVAMIGGFAQLFL